MTQSFSQKLNEIFQKTVLYFPKLRKFLEKKGFTYQDGKYVLSKELAKIANIQQQYGFEVEYIPEDNKFRVVKYSNDHMRSSVTPIESETEEQTIIIVQNLLDKFLNPKNNGLMGNQLPNGIPEKQ